MDGQGKYPRILKIVQVQANVYTDFQEMILPNTNHVPTAKGSDIDHVLRKSDLIASKQGNNTLATLDWITLILSHSFNILMYQTFFPTQAHRALDQKLASLRQNSSRNDNWIDHVHAASILTKICKLSGIPM
jgi:hypothetical protein